MSVFCRFSSKKYQHHHSSHFRDNFPCFFRETIPKIGNLVVYMAMTQSLTVTWLRSTGKTKRARCTASGEGPRQYSSRQSEQKIRERVRYRKATWNTLKHLDFNMISMELLSCCMLAFKVAKLSLTHATITSLTHAYVTYTCKGFRVGFRGGVSGWGRDDVRPAW